MSWRRRPNSTSDRKVRKRCRAQWSSRRRSGITSCAWRPRCAEPFVQNWSDCPLQDARYVIDTITFFAVSCPENPAFFRKNRQFFENIPRKILHILNILEKCCILEKSRKSLVKFGENSAKFWQNLQNFEHSAEKCSFWTKNPLLERKIWSLFASEDCKKSDSVNHIPIFL